MLQQKIETQEKALEITMRFHAMPILDLPKFKGVSLICCPN